MRVADFAEHYGAPSPSMFDIPPERAIEFFRSKGLHPSFSWLDTLEEEHEISFTVAKMMDLDLLTLVRESIDDAVQNGVPLEEWRKGLRPLLQERGWWGVGEVVDDATGETVRAQLGSDWRLETIFRTNVQSAYSAGSWDLIHAQEEEAPYLMYDAIDDYRTRDAHRAWDGIILPITSRWWATHCPTCGWNCRCSVIQLSLEDIEALGLAISPEPKVETRTWRNPRTGERQAVPVGVDPGFGKPPAQRKDRLERLAREKADAMPEDMREHAHRGLDAA